MLGGRRWKKVDRRASQPEGGLVSEAPGCLGGERRGHPHWGRKGTTGGEQKGGDSRGKRGRDWRLEVGEEGGNWERGEIYNMEERVEKSGGRNTTWRKGKRNLEGEIYNMEEV